MSNHDHDILWERKVCEWSYQDLTESGWEPGQVVLDQRTRLYFASLFADLECFLDELVSDKTPPFAPLISTNQGGAHKFTTLAERYFQRIPEFLKVVESLPPQNRYSEHLEAFIACCREMGLSSQTLEWNDPRKALHQTSPKFGGVSAAELFNMLVAKLRERCLSEQTKERARRRRNDADKRTEDYANYATALRGMTTRLLVLRIDLEYRKEIKDQISVVDALSDLDHFFKNQRHSKHFKGKLGFIVKLEHGVQKGLHFHLILFFDGSIKDGRRDVFWAQEIGEYWVNVITKGRGAYWNINDNKRVYKEKGILGIGLIHKHEDALFHNLKHRIIRYFCKSTQFVRPILPEDLESDSRGTNRIIRRGNYPKKAKKTRGRPPKIR